MCILQARLVPIVSFSTLGVNARERLRTLVPVVTPLLLARVGKFYFSSECGGMKAVALGKRVCEMVRTVAGIRYGQ